MKRAFLIAALGLLSLSAATSQAADANFSHVDETADDIKSRVNDVCWELYNFQRSRPGFNDTYRTAYDMWTVADHVHSLFHGGATNRQRIQRNVAELGDLFQQVNADIMIWSGPTQGYGHAQGCSFRLKQKLAALDISVQHLMNDVGVSRPVRSAAPSPGPLGPPSAPAIPEPSE